MVAVLCCHSVSHQLLQSRELQLVRPWCPAVPG